MQAPHADGTETEHGFVSLLPVADDRVRIVWLDGRETVSDGMMTLRTRTLTSAGGWGDETLLDPSVCDCCQTAAVTTSRGVTVAYRDRTSDETRDLYFTSLRDGTWTAPRALHDDGWRISACPVNGPALAAAGERVVATWFTGAGGVPRAYAAFSADGGDSFGDAVLLDAGATLGRVHAALLPDGSALLARLDGSEGPAAVRLQRVHADGRVEPPVTVARSDAARASGFPRIAAIGDGTVLVVWTEPGEPGGLRAARVSLPSAP